MVVLVPGERQPHALDRVADEADRPVVVDRLKSVDQGRQIVAGEIVHELRELLVGARFDQPGDGPLIADVV